MNTCIYKVIMLYSWQHTKFFQEHETFMILELRLLGCDKGSFGGFRLSQMVHNALSPWMHLQNSIGGIMDSWRYLALQDAWLVSCPSPWALDQARWCAGLANIQSVLYPLHAWPCPRFRTPCHNHSINWNSSLLFFLFLYSVLCEGFPSGVRVYNQ